MNEYQKAVAQTLINIGTIVFGGGVLALVMKDENLKEINFWLLFSIFVSFSLACIYVGLKILKKWSS